MIPACSLLALKQKLTADISDFSVLSGLTVAQIDGFHHSEWAEQTQQWGWDELLNLICVKMTVVLQKDGLISVFSQPKTQTDSRHEHIQSKSITERKRS